MQSQILFALDAARERQQRAIEQASVERRIARPRSTIRQSIGRSVIAFGRRIAAEPTRELAGSR
jgi:hypothetical protein